MKHFVGSLLYTYLAFKTQDSYFIANKGLLNVDKIPIADSMFLAEAKTTNMVTVNVFLSYSSSVVSESNTLVSVMLLRPTERKFKSL